MKKTKDDEVSLVSDDELVGVTGGGGFADSSAGPELMGSGNETYSSELPGMAQENQKVRLGGGDRYETALYIASTRMKIEN